MVTHPALATDARSSAATAAAQGKEDEKVEETGEKSAAASSSSAAAAAAGSAAGGLSPPPPPHPHHPRAQQIVGGHLGDARGVAAHPTKPLFATAAETPRVSVWNAATRAPIAATLVGFAARSVAFSACGRTIHSHNTRVFLVTVCS